MSIENLSKEELLWTYEMAAKQARAEIERLKDENATLREKLGKAVELPRIIHPNELEWYVQYQDLRGIINSDIKFSIEDAEALLKALQKEAEE